MDGRGGGGGEKFADDSRRPTLNPVFFRKEVEMGLSIPPRSVSILLPTPHTDVFGLRVQGLESRV